MILNFRLPSKFWPILTVLLAAVVLLLVIFLGTIKGKSQAQADLTVQNALETTKGLEYFFGDYGRYPSVLEFQNRDLMRNYFTAFPPHGFTSPQCGEAYIYKKISGKSYQLNFCLPSAAKGYDSGWNTISN